MYSLAKYPYPPHEGSLKILGEGFQELKLFIGKYEALWPHSLLISGSSSPGLSPGQGHCVVFMGTTLLSQCLSPPLFSSSSLGLCARLQQLPHVLWQEQCPNDWYARLQFERAGFKPRPGKLCCIFGQDTLLHGASLNPGV